MPLGFLLPPYSEAPTSILYAIFFCCFCCSHLPPHQMHVFAFAFFLYFTCGMYTHKMYVLIYTFFFSSSLGLCVCACVLLFAFIITIIIPYLQMSTCFSTSCRRWSRLVNFLFPFITLKEK